MNSALARTPLHWYGLLDLTGSRPCVPWRAAPDTLDHMDPYLAWLDASRFAGTPLLGACPTELAVLLKVSHDGDSVFGTAVAPLHDIVDYRPGQLIQIQANPRRQVLVDLAATIGLPRSNVGIARLFHKPTGLPAGAPAKPLIAIIDDGCPFARLGLRNGPTTRILRLWDQGAEDGPDSAPPPSFGYGSEWDRDALKRAIKSAEVPGDPTAIDEDACYRHLEMDLVGQTFRHGAHMLGLAAGDPDPWRQDGTRDAASEADILFVQLPRTTMSDTSGGSLPVHVLDALRWIDENTRVNSNGGTTEIPVVVNLCLGASAGPHDGSTLIEQAIDQFLHSRDHAMVVTATGNARQRRHRAAWQVGPGQTSTASWSIAQDDRTDSFVELWWDAVGRPPPSAQTLEVRLVPPGVDPDSIAFVPVGEARFVLDQPDKTKPAVAGVINAPSPVAKGDARCVLLCVAATAGDGRTERPLAPAGSWLVQTRVPPTKPSVRIDAWIERDDPSFGSRGSESEFGDKSSTDLRNHTTMASLAHGEGPMVIGGYEWDPLHPMKGPLDDNSGEGPGRDNLAPRCAPDLVAPSGEPAGGLEGVLSWGVHSGEWLRLQGTSAAAATVTRRVYNAWMELWLAGHALPVGAAAIKASFGPDIPSDPALESLSRVGRGRVTI